MPKVAVLDRGAELRQHLAWLSSAIAAAEPGALAALVRERRLTLAELAEVPVNSGRSTRNEIADKRDARRAAAATAKAPARRGKQRSS